MGRYTKADWYSLVSAHQVIEDKHNDISVDLLVFTHLGSGFFVNPDFVRNDALADLLQRAASTYYDLVKFCHAAQTMYQYEVPKTVEQIDEMLNELQWLEGHGIGHNRLDSEHFEDIAWAISNLKKHKKKMLKNTVVASETAEPGYIYLVQAIAPTTHYKIGYSKTPNKRIERMDVKLPFPIDVLKHIPTDDMRRAEKQLHIRYAHSRVNGEWFELSDDQVAEICNIKSMMFGGAA